MKLNKTDIVRFINIFSNYKNIHQEVYRFPKYMDVSTSVHS